MYPYRRNGPKKRGKGGQGRRQRGPETHRRLPGTIGELLPLLQPTTKALAQMLAGNTRTSGQLAHARNILVQAQRCVDDRLVERLPPMDREEFLEQLARLKLTIADADEMDLEADEAETVGPAVPTRVEPDRLREVAMRLAASSPAVSPAALPTHATFSPEPEIPDDEPPPPVRVVDEERARTRLRLPTAGEAGKEAPNGPGRGPRERLRLKSVSDPSADK